MAKKRSFSFLPAAVLRLFLLGIVLVEVSFLASRYRTRVDMTADQVYTLTSSTRTVLGKLENLLVIEAYFSPKSTLPATYQPARMQLMHLLEEYEQLGAPNVRLQIIDPTGDRNLRERATRLGIKEQAAQMQTSSSQIRTEVWQGLRIRYGGEKQEVIPLMQFGSTATYERQLTPLIKRLTVKVRKRIGVLAFRSKPGGHNQGLVINPEAKTPPQGFNKLSEIFSRNYDMVPIDLRQGALIPSDIRIALLIRPKFLSDRTKFILDQFLMSGGKLVVFADACEIEVRQDRSIRGTLVPYDAQGSGSSFLGMLQTYGVEVQNKVVAEGESDSLQILDMAMADPRNPRQIQRAGLYYPFIFEAQDNDWIKAVKSMAKDDEALQAVWAENIKPGINRDHDLMDTAAKGGIPGLFWPCPVDVMKPAPEGVETQVLMRTSPLSWTEAPNIKLDMFEEATHPQLRERSYQRWLASKSSMTPKAPSQTPLMVQAKGRFKSYFADRKVPPPPTQKKVEKKRRKKLDDWGEEIVEKPKKAEAVVPKPEEKTEPVVEESKLIEAKDGATLLVIGDATFVRDDFLLMRYQQPFRQNGMMGPVDRGGYRALSFVGNLLDWLAEERDLRNLLNKEQTDRSLDFGSRDEANQESVEEFAERRRSYVSRVQMLTKWLPGLLLAAFGLLVWLRRRVQKRAFLSGL